jgi:hypothetical protein
MIRRHKIAIGQVWKLDSFEHEIIHITEKVVLFKSHGGGEHCVQREWFPEPQDKLIRDNGLIPQSEVFEREHYGQSIQEYIEMQVAIGRFVKTVYRHPTPNPTGDNK